MKDQISKIKKIGIWGKGSSVADKLALLTNEDATKSCTYGYIIGFIHPKTNQPIFLANSANISDICYAKDPKLPGTTNIKHAKVYYSIEAAKADIYLLRYHHREFLRITTIAKPVAHFHAELLANDVEASIQMYAPVELIAETSSDPFEN